MKYIYLLIAAFAMMSCTENSKVVTVSVSNSLDLERSNEMIEVSMAEVVKLLQLPEDGDIVVINAEGEELPYQITFEDKLIFQVNVAPASTAVYTIKVGQPGSMPTVACGRQYPERVDDIAWENDLVAFRTYGPALQATGERAYGYDVWTKYNTTEPVVEDRYAMELDPETLAKIDSLKKVDPKAAQELRAATSYHVDHGNGLDCYKVGPTLGGGTAALMNGDEIVYPYCYTTHEVLDNGPLRFTVKLEYDQTALNYEKDTPMFTETRIISLDAGSYLNKAVISYAGLREATQVATGLVLHEAEGLARIVADAEAGYITYVDPTDNATADNGKIFVGAAFPAPVKEAKAVFFDQKEAKERGADGHVLGISSYEPNTSYVYYFGAAWSKAAIKDAESWNTYMANYAAKVRTPLTVTVQ